MAILSVLLPTMAIVALPTQAQARTAAGTAVNFYNVATGWCVDLPNYGATYNSNVYQYPCDYTSADNQQWELVPTRSVNVGGTLQDLFLIRNVKSRQCMDLPSTGDNPATTPVWMHNCISSGDNQEWFVMPGNSGGWYYVNLASNKCLDVPGWAHDGTDRGNGSPLTIYPCWHEGWAWDGADDHLWILRQLA
ncbi:RICIN domain-containing protein [Streptomyces sp. TLI_146]|uniref:RICIN domain-containing protein n=1 Tax=Streptomyces sp. TLI_146 TaxID=1938858 RepID=UPI0015D5E953|nr:RICIN domain-containing protein [Streptomyces sp. TLI_146]